MSSTHIKVNKAGSLERQLTSWGTKTASFSTWGEQISLV